MPFILMDFMIGAQEDTSRRIINDSIVFMERIILSDTTLTEFDSAYLVGIRDIDDTNGIDTIKPKKTVTGLKSKVKYGSMDSLRFDINKQMVYIYGNAEIYYEDISLKSAYIDIDFQSNLVFATGLKDTTGKEKGLPVFSEKSMEFQSRTMKYNYETKKGLILDVVTQDGEGNIYGSIIKKMPNDEVNIKKGSYTTCPPCENKDYEFRYFKSKVIPGKRIVTGPAYLVIEDVPTPLFIPFGIFPNRSGQRSGIVIPTWGESAKRGFYFENGGYYWAINDYMDLKLVGDIYTHGSWAAKPSMRYNKRYKFRGNFDFIYAVNIIDEKGSPDYKRDRDYSIRWVHRQDPKARPHSRFSADVNVKSSKSNYYNPTSAQDYLSNTYQSSISYQTNFAGKYFLTVNANQSQSTIDQMMNITLPEITFSVSRFYPLRNKNRVGKFRWYENISIDYSMVAKNTVSIADSLLFKPDVFDEMKNGIKHSLPVTSSIKLLKYLTWSNRININDRMYFRSIERYWTDDTLISNGDTTVGYVKTDTMHGFKNAIDLSFSSSISTKLYGMMQFGRKSPLQAIRHVLTPSVGFSYTPSYAGEGWGYYKTYYDPDKDKDVEYSIFEGSLYGSPPKTKSGRVNFSLNNNLEIKIRSRKDTITGTKKIALIDNFTISTSYDLAKDSLRWSKVRMGGRTRLFKGFDVTYSSSWDPYVLDSSGTKNLNKFEWTENRRLLRLDNTTWNLGLLLTLNPNMFKKAKATDRLPASTVSTAEEIDNINKNIEDYIDWSIPWSLSINYNMRITRRNNYVNNEKETIEDLVQTLGLRGDISVTPKWKIGFMTGWDFESSKLSYTSLNIYRDLHCFEMRFNWIPIGYRKSWNFALNIKSSLLQDMKLTKKKDFRDL
ncbi:MAG: LPS-assembly protein LptD [Bacteroidetes bacterium]|nr:LPS-assembly protein LptD [Bacteroidota bacterium]